MTPVARRLLGALACCGFLVLVPDVPAARQRQNAQAVERQAGLFFEAVEDVLAGEPDAVRRQVRIMGVGSWMAGEAGELSDIDATLGHPDPRVRERLVRTIKTRVDSKAGAAHTIKIIAEHDPKFDELFVGETGERFFRDYADKKGGGRAAFAWSKSADGTLVRHQLATERFWLDRNLPVPQRLTRPSTLVEDSVVMLTNMARKGDPALTRALAAAKYANNVDSWLNEALVSQYGDHVRPLLGDASAAPLDQALRAEMKELLSLKKQMGAGLTSDQAVNRLRTLWSQGGDALTDEQLAAKLDGFINRTTRHLTAYRDQVDLVDYLQRTGALARIPNGEAAAAFTSVVKRILGGAARRMGSALVLTQVYGVVDRFYREGERGAAEEIALTLIGYGLPEAEAAAIVAQIAKDLVAAGVEVAGDAFVFAPINDTLLRAFYEDRTNSLNIFMMTGSPFHGYNRETLWMRCPHDDADTGRSCLEGHVAPYVAELRAQRSLAGAPAGAGSLPSALLGRLMSDWLRSREIAAGLRQQGAALQAGIVEPARRPLRVFVNGSEVFPREPRTFRASAQPGAAGAAFTIEIERQFGLKRSLPSLKLTNEDAGRVATRGWGRALLEKWKDLGSYAQMQTWIAGHIVEEYDLGNDVHYGMRVAGGQGWTGTGVWRGLGGGGDATHDAALARLGNRGGSRLPARQVALQQTFAPTPAARGVVEFELGLRLWPEGTAFNPARDLTYRVVLVTTPAQPATQETDWSAILQRAMAKVEAERAGAKPPPASSADVCYKAEADSHQNAVNALARIRDKGAFAKWSCNPQSMNQEWASKACCDRYDRDRPAGVDQAFLALQACGWTEEIARRKEALEKKQAACAKGVTVKTP